MVRERWQRRNRRSSATPRRTELISMEGAGDPGLGLLQTAVALGPRAPAGTRHTLRYEVLRFVFRTAM